MIVLILEKVPVTLRGELSRWLIEPHRGIFVGRVSALVRDKIWDLACDKLKGGAALLIYPYPNEQGMIIRTSGQSDRAVIDYEGLSLICVKE